MSDIISKAETYVTELLSKELSNQFLYHNLKHTQRVAKSTKELLDNTEVNEEAKELLMLSAWFHDSGFIQGCENHEDRSAEIAGEWLKQENLPEEKIAKVAQYIKATRMGYSPQSLEEEIIRDADASHFAKESYIEIAEFLRKEINTTMNKNMSGKEWRKTNIEMLENNHQYYTDYAKENWQQGKDKNINTLKKIDKEKKAAKEALKKEKAKQLVKDESPERTIQTTYRVALKNHLDLSSIADTKANILLSVNSIILSVVLTSLLPKLDNPSNKYLIVPAAIFTLSSVISMILSVLATIPNVTRGRFTADDIARKKVNLLFFGNFHKMSLSDYEDAMQVMVKDKEYLLSSLTKDLYFLGKVLNKKYNLLRITYTIFIIGIIISVIAFAVSYASFGMSRVLT